MEEKKISASLEDYLEAIYKIIEEKQAVKAIEVSRRLGVRRSSVTEALKTLASKNLVNYGRYDVISLTPEGKQAAQNVIFKHEILYQFLTSILGIESEDAEQNACKIEHVISDTLLSRVNDFINFNKQDSNSAKYLESFKNFYNSQN